MSDFEYIDVVFENCDVVRVPHNLVNRLRLIDIKHSVFINFSGQFIETWECQEFEVELKNEAIDIKTHWQTLDEDDESFKRHLVTFKDVTHIFISDKELYIAVPWESTNDNDVSNKLQKTKFDTDTFTIGSKYGVPETS